MASRKPVRMTKLGLRDIVCFRIANRKGYATLARNHLTEGRTLIQAYARLIKACRRHGLELPEADLAALDKRCR
ncbi:MAG: hypothetical protein A2498_01715 [Lentisphaerae bacterium RIFOXYC12_FULL_60_16]|nr:MAG: hypothetical protein A2498_01715 [Lentisphaerae bacterium RIFOXYC12_FULL_60_16]OGV77590.1 MAG: hypothetical protein A2340_15040 [Lentisphaerae bacterium RIFOXYB12_FULL_60_10]